MSAAIVHMSSVSKYFGSQRVLAGRVAALPSPRARVPSPGAIAMH